MNFQTISQTFGQKDEKGYQISLSMFATLLEIGTAKLDRNNRPYASCKLIDDNQETHSATIRAGLKGLPVPNMLGKRCIFQLQPYQGQQGIAFGGFCNGLAAPAPYQGQQGLPQPPQAPKPPQTGQYQEKTTRTSIERQTAVAAACERYAGYMDITDEAVLAFAGKIAYFIATGMSLADKEQIDQEEAKAAAEISEPSPDDSDVPF